MELTRGPGPRKSQGMDPPSPPCVKHIFLFVNESTSTAGKKVGRRRDIKSHVRNHIVQRERRDRKKETTTNRDANLTKTRQPPQTVIGFEDQDEDQGLFSQPYNPEADIEWHIPQPGLNSNADQDTHSTALPIRDPLEPRQLYIEHGALPRDVFTESTATKDKDYHAIQEVHESYCLACGAPQRKKPGTNSRDSNEGRFSLIAKEAVRWQSLRAEPLTVLGSGRKDPFSCYPTMVDDPNGSLHELMDHSVSYLLPGLLADGSRTEVSSVSKAWMAGGLKSPLLFHALVFAGSIHLDFLRTNLIHPNAPVALSHKLAVIQQLNKVLSDPIERMRDEIILAILILSSHEVMDLSGPKSSPFNSPLKSMQWLNVYGNIRNVHEHLKAVMDLVTLRGGVESLELYGLAEILIGGDVVAATTTLSKPAFLPLVRSLQWVADVVYWAKSPPRLPYITLGRGFKNYRQYGITSEIIYLFEAISAVTTGIEHYLQGEPMGLTLTTIARTRTACQQQLLSLPSATEISEIPFEKPYIYEAVRLTALIYGVAVLLPIPRSYSVLKEIVRRQRTAIEESEIESYGEPLSDLLLWILVLGGIASLDKPERNWYEERLVDFVQKRDFKDWKNVERIMGKFLWLDSACRPGGRRLWGLIIQRCSFIDMNPWADSTP